MIVLSYLWILALIPLLVEKDDREVQWHARHGLVLLAAELVLSIILWIITFAVDTMACGGGCVTGIVSLVLWLGILVVHVMAIVKGLNGQRLIIPGLSQYADKF
jgi:uncharacterized membrane protein